MRRRLARSAVDGAGVEREGQAIGEIGTTRTITGFAIMLFVLSAVDLVTTEALRQFGAVELNPLMAPVLGTWRAVVVKLGIPAAIVLAAPRAKSIVVARAIKLTVIIYIAVAVFNVTQLLAVVVLY